MIRRYYITWTAALSILLSFMPSILQAGGIVEKMPPEILSHSTKMQAAFDLLKGRFENAQSVSWSASIKSDQQGYFDALDIDPKMKPTRTSIDINVIAQKPDMFRIEVSKAGKKAAIYVTNGNNYYDYDCEKNTYHRFVKGQDKSISLSSEDGRMIALLVTQLFLQPNDGPMANLYTGDDDYYYSEAKGLTELFLIKEIPLQTMNCNYNGKQPVHGNFELACKVKIDNNTGMPNKITCVIAGIFSKAPHISTMLSTWQVDIKDFKLSNEQIPAAKFDFAPPSDAKEDKSSETK